jgi:hypothetical protein
MAELGSNVSAIVTITGLNDGWYGITFYNFCDSILKIIGSAADQGLIHFFL